MDHYQQAAKTLIVIVNWKNPWDTLECLESLLRLDNQGWAALVCDNDSQDGSMEIFKAWSEGKLCVHAATSPLHGQQGAEGPSAVFFEKPGHREQAAPPYPSKSIVFIANDSNAGFAGGNNVGLRLALQQAEAKWVWLLNNDTVAAPASLDWQIQRSERHARPHMIGVTIMEYFQPQEVQYNGGATYNDFTTQVRPIRQSLPAKHDDPARFEHAVEQQISYVSGASMFLPMATLRMLGLMDDRYFLYYEELDWVADHRGKLDLLYAAKAVIYHKEGGTTGGKTVQKIKSRTSEYYAARSRLMYTLKHRRAALLTVIPIQLFALFKRALINRQTENAKIVLKASVDAFKLHWTATRPNKVAAK